MNQLCYNCFKQIGDKTVCPHCGYEQYTPSDENCLQPGTLITGRYLVGRVRGSDEDGIVYNVFDLKNETKKRMREFFPERHCTRGKDGEVLVKAGHEKAFEKELNNLKLNSVGDDGVKKYNYLAFNGTGYFIERKQKKPAAAVEKAEVEELEENGSVSKKLPFIIGGAVAVIALIVAGVVIFGGGSGDPTQTGTTPTATVNEIVLNPTSNSTVNTWDLPTNTPASFDYAEPTVNITHSYSEWMAESGSKDQTITTATPSPTPTPYNMWDELAKDIQKQSTPTPTPAPTRKTVNGNSTYEEISALQWQLIELGWLEASYPSGKYDTATLEAVKAFQQYMNSAYNVGLSVDGICGPKTFAYLNNYSIAIKPTPTYNVVTPTPTAQNVIDKNSSPVEIRDIQLKLSAQGWYNGEADGVYDYNTMDAVIRFQTYVNTVNNSHWLDVTGYVDENTLLLLNSYWYPAPAEPTEAPEVTQAPTPTADPMDETDKLELLDTPVDIKIIASPYAYVYERASINSSVVAQAPTGSVFMMLAKSDSWALLSNTQDANRYVKLSDIEIIEQEQPEPDEGFVIDPSSSKENIAALQSRLIEQGWLEGSADGIYGNATKAAVSSFQSYVNQVAGYQRLSVTGIADGDTLDELLSEMYINPNSVTSQPTATPIVFTEVFETVYVRALHDGTAIYRTPDPSDVWMNVNSNSEYYLKATGGEWLMILNPANNVTAYVYANEFTAYTKQEASAVPTEAPTSTPTSEPTSTPTSEPTATPTSAPTSTPEAEPVYTEQFITVDTGRERMYAELTYDSDFMYDSYNSANRAIVRTLYMGDVFEIIAYSDNWAYGTYTDATNGRTYTGYVSRQGLVRVAAPTPTNEVAAVVTQAPTATPTNEPTATPTQEPTATPTMEPTPTPTAEPTPTPTAEPTPTPTAEPTPTPTAEPTPTPTAEPTPTPGSDYDPNWINDTGKVRAFQEMLGNKGWLDIATLTVWGEYGNLGDMTYAAIYDVQQYAKDSRMNPVRDAAGFYKTNNGTGDYYPIDEITYNYIMNNLPKKP